MKTIYPFMGLALCSKKENAEKTRGVVLDVSDSNLYKNGIVPRRREVE